MLTGQNKVKKKDLLQWIENYRWMVEQSRKQGSQ